MANPRTDSPERFLVDWEKAFGPFLQDPGLQHGELIEVIGQQERALIQFSEVRPFPTDRLAEVRKIGVTRGQEHEVYVPAKWSRSALVWKVTRPERWGLRFATPRDYLVRMARMNEHNDTDIRIRGIAILDGRPLLVSSMRYIEGTHMGYGETHERLLSDGWEPANDPEDPTMLTYRLKLDGTLMRDAHRLNFVLTPEDKLTAIDVIYDYRDRVARAE